MSVSNSTHKNFKTNILPIFLIALLFALTLWLIYDLLPLMVNIVEHIKNENVVISEIRGYGSKSVLILFAMQVLQIVTSVLPAAPIQILAGLTFGSLYGTGICLLGYVAGNGIMFLFSRKVRQVVSLKITLPGRKKAKPKWEFSFLKSAENKPMLAFLLALIPGIPNGILPYLFSKTDITLPRYLLSVFLAGIPTIYLSCFAGERIANGDIMTAVAIAGALLLMAGVVVLLNKRITGYFRNKQTKTGKR